MTRPSEAEVTELMSVGQCEACGGPTVSLARHICEPCKARALSTPPLPSAPERDDDAEWDAVFVAHPEATRRLEERLRAQIATTPHGAAQDTGRGISESVRGDIQDATYDALMYFGAHDLHKPSDYLVAAQKVANDIAARAAGGE